MTPRLLALPLTLLLAACGPGASTDADTAPAADSPADAPADAPPPAQAAEPAATDPAPAAGPAAAPPAQPGAQTDAEQAVDASIERVLGDPAPYRAVIERLQTAVAAGDAATVAALVDYPIQVRIDDTPTTLDDEAAFVAQYDAFMTPGIRDAIVDTGYGDLFVNQDGVMLGSGQAWINGICQDSACDEVEVKVVTLQPGAD